MLIESLAAEAFATNCYVVAPKAGSDCVIVDPGIGIGPRLDDLLSRHRLRAAAVMLTHGHLDHTFSVMPVCGADDISAYIHPGDRAQLRDPFGWLPPQFQALAGSVEWTEPDNVEQLPQSGSVNIAGMEFTVDHAPGHTPGSVLYRLPGDDDAASYCLSGDVLFAGSIGRTDLPGGDGPTMNQTLATKVLPLDDGTVVLPGHGPRTTIGAERRTNPFLRRIAQSGHTQAPTRGM